MDIWDRFRKHRGCPNMVHWASFIMLELYIFCLYGLSIGERCCFLFCTMQVFQPVQYLRESVHITLAKEMVSIRNATSNTNWLNKLLLVLHHWTLPWCEILLFATLCMALNDVICYGHFTSKSSTVRRNSAVVTRKSQVTFWILDGHWLSLFNTVMSTLMVIDFC